MKNVGIKFFFPRKKELKKLVGTTGHKSEGNVEINFRAGHATDDDMAHAHCLLDT